MYFPREETTSQLLHDDMTQQLKWYHMKIIFLVRLATVVNENVN